MTTYYIKSAGSDVADGLSDANAWLTPSTKDSAISGQDTLRFKRGNTWTGGSTVEMDFSESQAGISGTPTLITSYDAGPKPILDANWDNLGNFDYLILVAGASYFEVEDLDLRHAGPQSSGTNDGSGLIRITESSAAPGFCVMRDMDLDGAWRQGAQYHRCSAGNTMDTIDVTDTGRSTFSGFTGPSAIDFSRCNGGSLRVTNCNSYLSGAEGISLRDGAGASSADPFIGDFNYVFMMESANLYFQAANQGIFRHNLVVHSDNAIYADYQQTGPAGGTYGDNGLIYTWESTSNGPSASTSCPHDLAYISNLVSGAVAGISIGEQDPRATSLRNRFENNTIVDCGMAINTGTLRSNNVDGVLIRNNAFFAQSSTALYHGSGDSPRSNWSIGPNYWADGFISSSANNFSASDDVNSGLAIARTSSFRTPTISVITTADFQPNVSASGGSALGHTDENGNALGVQFGGLAFVGNNKIVTLSADLLEFTGGAVTYKLTGPPSDAQGQVISNFSVAVQNEVLNEVNLVDRLAFRVSI